MVLSLHREVHIGDDKYGRIRWKWWGHKGWATLKRDARPVTVSHIHSFGYTWFRERVVVISVTARKWALQENIILLLGFQCVGENGLIVIPNFLVYWGIYFMDRGWEMENLELIELGPCVVLGRLLGSCVHVHVCVCVFWVWGSVKSREIYSEIRLKRYSQRPSGCIPWPQAWISNGLRIVIRRVLGDMVTWKQELTIYQLGRFCLQHMLVLKAKPCKCKYKEILLRNCEWLGTTVTISSVIKC